MVDVEEFSKEKDGWLCLEIHFAKDLELAEIGDGVGAKILRLEVERVENVTEEF